MADNNLGQGAVAYSFTQDELDLLKAEVSRDAYAGMTAEQAADALNAIRFVPNPKPAPIVRRPSNSVEAAVIGILLDLGIIDADRAAAVMDIPDPAFPATVPASSIAFDLFPGKFLFIEPSDLLQFGFS